jgi:outer membrane receptor protein involved in Fe transport
MTDLPRASGYDQASLLSPKANLVFSPWNGTDLYLNGGMGFHSNDARAVVVASRTRQLEKELARRGLSEGEIDSTLLAHNLDPAHADLKTLPQALGAEIGIRTRGGDWFILSLAAWWLHLEEELVFVGDEGTTEASGATRRLGVDAEARIQITPWLWADLDLSLADGVFIDEPAETNRIPLAPRVTSTGGLTVIHPSGLEANLRYRYIGDRPANEANTVTALGYFILTAGIGQRFGHFEVFANFQNILNAEWNEAQFDTESRLPGEAVPVSELHFTPGNPANIMLGISYEF